MNLYNPATYPEYGISCWTAYSAKTTAATAAPQAFTPYTVKVTVDKLNYRDGAGTDFKAVGSVKQGETYTIVAESSGEGAAKWGKLKSGAGWIALDFCQRK